MGVSNPILASSPLSPGIVGRDQWYAVHVRARHEKRVRKDLEEKGIATYLPLLCEEHNWSDRRQRVEVPLFPCYVFVSIIPAPEIRVSVLQALGVLGFVGSERHGTPIPDKEIEDIRTLLCNGIPVMAHPFLVVGRKVRIRGGSLDGVEGILSDIKGDRRLVVSVNTINRAFSISVEGYRVEPL